VRWWKAIYDDAPTKLLPDAKTAKALAKVIRPTEFRVHADGEVGVRFEPAWRQADGFGVLLRGGEVVAIGDEEVALAPPAPPAKKGEAIEHPILGPLRRANDEEWVGSIHLPSWREFYNVVEERRAWRQLKGEYVRWSPPWNFVDGNFALTVYVERGHEPTDAQAAAFAAFVKNEPKAAGQIQMAIFDWYRANAEKYRETMDEDGDELMPAVESPGDLRELITLNTVNIFTPRGRKPPATGLSFGCSWDGEHGLVVRWRGGAVEAFGGADEVHG
jgi:hypothetical protein